MSASHSPGVPAFLAGIGVLGALALVRHRRRDLEGVPPWWNKPHPRDKWQRSCYLTKTDALKVFADANWRLIEDWGGIDAQASPAEFDAVNHKYGLSGKRAARTIGEALWAAMPPGRPFCLDQIDLDALNDTSPAQDHPVGFRLPDFIEEEVADRAHRSWYSEQQRVAA